MIVQQLLKYQEVDEKLKAIEDALKGSEEFKKYAQATKFLKTVDDSRILYEDRSSALISNFNEKQSELAKLIDEMNDLSESLADDADEKEISFLSKRASELQKKLQSLESQIQKLESEIKEVLSQYSNFVKKTKVYMEQRKENKEKYEKLLAEKEAERKSISDELKVLEKDIPEDLMKVYKDKRKDGKFKIVCKVENGYCTSCNTELVIAEKEKLKKEKIIECPNCHKLIYV